MRDPVAWSLTHVKQAWVLGSKMRINIIHNDLAMKLHQEGSAPALAQAAAWSQAIGLDRLPRHQQATVSALRPASTDTEKNVVLRLMEIGFLPGEPVRVVAAGVPGGDPIAVRIGQATFALRRHEAALVEVRLQGAPA